MTKSSKNQKRPEKREIGGRRPPASPPSPKTSATASAEWDPELAKAIPAEGIPLTIEVNTDALASVLEAAEIAPPEIRELTLEAFQVRLNETFDRL
ncbi:MAG: hypothetical protein ACLFRG_15610, partial [Desulfococcaceae bacterium]